MSVTHPNRLYVDLDDVVGETSLQLLDLAAKEYGCSVTFEQMTSYELDEVFDLSSNKVQEFYTRSNESDILIDIMPRAGAIEKLASCRNQGLDVWIVTGRPPHTYETTRTWLASCAVPHDELLFVDKYGPWADENILSPVDPISLDDLVGLPFRAAIEDHLGMARFIVERMMIPVLLMDRPWNRDANSDSHSLDAHPLVTRCRDWSEVPAALGLS